MVILHSQSTLIHNLALFGRLLRYRGVNVSSGRIAELVEGLLLVDLRRRDDVYNTCRCPLVHRRSEQTAFDQAFGAFWRVWTREQQPEEDWPSPSQQTPAADRSGLVSSNGSLGSSEAASALTAASSTQEDTGHAESHESWSHEEQLRTKNFAAYTPEELLEARRIIGKMHWQMARRTSRRLKASGSGKQLDIRKTLRLSLPHGGEMLEVAHKRPKVKLRPVVVLCDISGSMSPYTRLLLHFLHSLEHGMGSVESFVFGTRLTRLTPQLRHRSADSAVTAAASQVLDWSGGTRIGDALRTFNRLWSRRVLDRGAIVMVISDGWDRGDPELLARETARLQRSSFRLIWLNPLAGSPSYQPLTRGLVAALPFVDDVVSVRNIASLEVIAQRLGALRPVRPDRRQQSLTSDIYPGQVE